MTKLGPIDFDECILDALRNEALVVFAGAGVSMGAPSNLASFEKLAIDIAMGTGEVAVAPLDRFLGQLDHKKVAVHERAAQFLSPVGSAPNTLHQDLLRLFRSSERVRLVTTNFDHHFETASKTVFGSLPELYRAPALPLGREFSGIVHVHGSLTRPREMVLTDADFGRAYLTEGWARRFLVEVFRQYTVLFVGYSHDDVVMNYLVRALPAESFAGRFALTDEDGNWNLLGIKPIRFNITDGETHNELYEGVKRLAERVTRGALDWQSRLSEIGSCPPPTDEEVIGEVDQALREEHTTRFLLNVAKDTEWPRWLNSRKHIDTLFDTIDLSETDKLLASWLADNFAIEHPDVMFDLIAAHGMRMNPIFWWFIGREIGIVKEKTINDSALKRWITILLACAPRQADHHILMWLAERSACQGAIALTLKVFLFMSEYRLNIKPGFVWVDKEDSEHGQRLDLDCPLYADHWTLNEVWSKHLKPHIAEISQSLLSGTAQRFEEMHHDLVAWDKASRDWDPISYGRSAIEPHAQDNYPQTIDVLIDISRDALEWLADNSPALLESWVERLVASDVPMLRRLSIHAISVHPDKSPDECLSWLIDRVGLHCHMEHHEIHRLVALNYKVASEGARQVIVDALCTHNLPAFDDWSSEKNTARSHFDWLSWLLQSKPDCFLAESALAPIKAEYPEWQPSEHPDFTHWVGSARWVGPRSPWSIEQLLSRAPSDQLDELLAFKGNHFHGPDRDGLIGAIKDACNQNKSWAFTLAEILTEKSLWSSDIWPAILRSWQEAELSIDEWHIVLAIIAKSELHTEHAYDVANLLYSLVKDGGKAFALNLLELANAIAQSVWQSSKPNEQDENIQDWLSQAISRPAGIIVEYWINGLSLLMHGKSDPERTLPEDFRTWFTMAVQDSTLKGGLGRALLASQAAFLFGLDEIWTCQHIIPLFSDANRQRFCQAWDGFLVWGRLFPALVDTLMPSFIAAFARLDTDLLGRRQRFIEFYTALVVFHVTDPTQELLPALFQYGSAEDRIGFASHLGYFLRQMQPLAKQQLWDRWLYRYWKARQQAVPAALDEAEIKKMLEWLPDLGNSFPLAVSLAIRSPALRIEYSHLLYELRESDLVTTFPTETAELLIYLCNCVVGYHVADLGIVAARLPTIAVDLRCKLDEGLARIGAKKE